jgi:uncharacterized protein (TIGR03382 family)
MTATTAIRSRRHELKIAATGALIPAPRVSGWLYHVYVRALAIRLSIVGLALCPAVAAAAPRVIYLNRTGTTLQPGSNDSRAGTSSLVNQLTTIQAWQADNATWSDTMTCFKELYAPFNVTVIDYDPGPDIEHIEGVFGGDPAMFGIASNSLGVSPFMPDCSMIESSIAFAFVDALPDTRSICEVMAQEVAHSYGVDHELLASDLMSYLVNDGARRFQDSSVPCGEYEARPCGAGGFVCRPEQNSFALLAERLGANPHPDDPDNPANAELSGGCSSTSGGGALQGLLVALGALVLRRRSVSSGPRRRVGTVRSDSRGSRRSRRRAPRA